MALHCKINKTPNFGFVLKMSIARTRTSLGRTPLNLNLNIPPSPRSIVSQQGSTVPSLTELLERQSPRFQNPILASPVIPGYEEESFYEERTSTLPDFVKRQSLDEELTRSGYSPLSKMVMVSPQGESQVKYVKAQNQLGEQVYVAIDVEDSFISQGANDPRLRESKLGFNIPQVEKELAFSKAGLGVAGVAFECKSGLCTLMHDEQINAPREQNFVLIHTKKVEESLVLASYPVVKMSEIRCNPQACLKNIDCALRRMRNAALDRCLCQINEVQKKFKEMCCLFDQTLECKENVIKEFKRTINLLEDSYDNCIKCPEKNKCKIDQIVYNIEVRNCKFPALMESCKDIACLDPELDKIICSLKKAKHKLEKKFKKLHCAYELKKKKKHHHHKCAWEEKCGDYSSSDSDSDHE